MTDKVTKQADDVKLIVFACEAGMGSSLMGANQLKKLVKKAKLDIKVIHALRDVAVILLPMLLLLLAVILFPDLVLLLPRLLTPQFL